MSPEIKLLKGFCNVNFGESLSNVKKIFGDPEEVQSLEDSILNTSTTVYHYWEQGFSLFFDNLRNQAFCSVEIDNRDTLLMNTKVFALSEKELVEFMKQNGYGLSDMETHEWGEKRVSFDSAGLDCYYENNKMVSVNFGVIEGNDNFYFFPN
ncbi:MAG: hypothetical protein H0W61_15985 [Bacteroidetes bacterium]|nr:hypothetical protein [Bacteroidota bacterium]